MIIVNSSKKASLRFFEKLSEPHHSRRPRCGRLQSIVRYFRTNNQVEAVNVKVDHAFYVVSLSRRDSLEFARGFCDGTEGRGT